MNLKLVIINRIFQEPLNFGVISEENQNDFVENYVEKLSRIFELKDVKREGNSVFIYANDGTEKMVWKIEFVDVLVDDYKAKLNPTDFEGRKKLRKLIY